MHDNISDISMNDRGLVQLWMVLIFTTRKSKTLFILSKLTWHVEVYYVEVDT